jgi:hypothetical protein
VFDGREPRISVSQRRREHRVDDPLRARGEPYARAEVGALEQDAGARRGGSQRQIDWLPGVQADTGAAHAGINGVLDVTEQDFPSLPPPRQASPGPEPVPRRLTAIVAGSSNGRANDVGDAPMRAEAKNHVIPVTSIRSRRLTADDTSDGPDLTPSQQ